jgi:hypothetical protein
MTTRKNEQVSGHSFPRETPDAVYVQDVKDWIYVAKRELLAEMTRVREELDSLRAWESNGPGKPKVGYPHGTDECDREKIRKLRNHHYRLEGRWDMLDWVLPSYLLTLNTRRNQPVSFFPIKGKKTLVSLNLASD